MSAILTIGYHECAVLWNRRESDINRALRIKRVPGQREHVDPEVRCSDEAIRQDLFLRVARAIVLASYALIIDCVYDAHASLPGAASHVLGPPFTTPLLNSAGLVPSQKFCGIIPDRLSRPRL
jgi:hypothetical protein